MENNGCENYGYELARLPGKTRLGFRRERGRESEDSAMSERNQETIYCGEVIGDDVQLWTETGDLSETKWLGKKHDLEHNKEPENMKIKHKMRQFKGIWK